MQRPGSVNHERHEIFFARIAASGVAVVIPRIVDQRRHLPALVCYEDING